MRNPRRLHDHRLLVEKHRLDTQAPAADSLFWRLWQDGGSELAHKALATGFVQGIRTGSLDPRSYGAFNVSDIYYCCKGADDFGDAALRTRDPVLRDFLLHKQQSYEKYYRAACREWRLADPKAVLPSDTAKRYSDFERRLATGQAEAGKAADPIYTLIAMLPCEYLWGWLAQQLSPATDTNLYGPWISSNACVAGAFAIGNFIEAYIGEHAVDEELARQLYLTAMELEYRNFEGALQ
ncbi:hypothetical protein [Shewanella sedimentimangrovi]|uniref:TenA family transcriptional regulator n=1 Tax=Shewanella sedimentimangrovi TaxID=2814293 RepID=A0ABX7R2V4_9GAMM|nr:hypothetical protein [Shewanella sedimentimangrovi]QSX37408.1 hypothetical protein JYB85_00680 [Shewanella sedimentimangrovi]